MFVFWECEGGHLGEHKAFFFQNTCNDYAIYNDSQFWLHTSYADWLDEREGFELNGNLGDWERADRLIPDHWKNPPDEVVE